MRTKTLLLAAAALAAGLATSMAQSNVYSVNVVGYINYALGTQKTLLSNPLNNGTNDLVSVDAGIIPNKSAVSIWNGTGYSASTKANGTWNNNLQINPGTGFFVTAKSACTLTFVGSAPTSNNYALGTVKSLIGGVIPMAGTITDAGPNSLNIGTTLPNKSAVSAWNGTGYAASTKANGTWNNILNFTAAQGFFVTPKAAVTWIQYLQ